MRTKQESRRPPCLVFDALHLQTVWEGLSDAEAQRRRGSQRKTEKSHRRILCVSLHLCASASQRAAFQTVSERLVGKVFLTRRRRDAEARRGSQRKTEKSHRRILCVSLHLCASASQRAAFQTVSERLFGKVFLTRRRRDAEARRGRQRNLTGAFSAFLCISAPLRHSGQLFKRFLSGSRAFSSHPLTFHPVRQTPPPPGKRPPQGPAPRWQGPCPGGCPGSRPGGRAARPAARDRRPWRRRRSTPCRPSRSG
jgi:hypothetical protein